MLRMLALVYITLMILPFTALAQAQAPASGPGGSGPVRTVLANTSLRTVVDAPRHFRLVTVSLAAKQATTYNGPVGFVLVLDGAVDIESGADSQTLAKGDGALVAAARSTVIKAGGGKRARYLHFVLSTSVELDAPLESKPAVVEELRRTPAPIPGLKAGPYEFSLVRVTFPPRFPFNAPHHRSGAALYYIASGSGMIAFGDKKEGRPTGAIQYEPSDFVHHWANPGDKPLIMIQANISQEGVPAVVFVKDADASASK